MSLFYMGIILILIYCQFKARVRIKTLEAQNSRLKQENTKADIRYTLLQDNYRNDVANLTQQINELGGL